MSRRHLRRRIHRALVPIAAVPLIITVLSGSIYGLMLANNIDAFWLLRVAARRPPQTTSITELKGKRSGTRIRTSRDITLHLTGHH